MLAAYFDESYNNRILLVGCLLARGAEIKKLERLWAERIKKQNRWLVANGRKPISRYHAAEMNAKAHEFKGWNDEESKAFSQHLLRLMKQRKLYVVAYAVVLPDMMEVFPETKADPKGDAYEHAMWRCLLFIHDQFGKHIPESARSTRGISVVYDRGDFSARASAAYDKVRNDPNLPYRDCFNSKEGGSYLSHVALQPTDLLAYEGFRETGRKLFSSTAEMRKFFQRMIAGHHIQIYVAYVDKERLIEWKEHNR